MNIRIWGKKIVAVLRHHHYNPHTTLFGITGDLDNLGVYVARHGRAKAEVLVDTYNRVIGLLYHKFIEQHPHLFYESNFLPAGEEIFVLGTCANEEIAEEIFQYLRNVSIPELLVEAGLGREIMVTDVSFGCSILTPVIGIASVGDLLAKIDRGDLIGANQAYIAIIENIRNILAGQLDIEKFADITQEKDTAILLRNLIYAKTLQYKYTTRDLLVRLGQRISTDPELYARCLLILGNQYGLGDKEYRKIITELEQM